MPLQTNNANSQAIQLDTSVKADVSPRRHLIGRIALLLILAVIGLLYWQHQSVYDWARLVDYTPPPAIAKLAEQTTMTDHAKHLYYINHPQINSRSDFLTNCKQHEQTIVLGCYHGGETGIFILKIVDNPELSGVEQVTAAHEMLHAAYDRLDGSAKQKLNAELESFYISGQVPRQVEKEINQYKKTEPTQLKNEMHSIFGTEVANLPAGLETYYSQYFTDRHQVVKYAEHYQKAFRSRQQQIKHYKSLLPGIKAQVNDNEAQLRSLSGQLDSIKADIQADKRRRNWQQYNQDVDKYNQMVRQYNAILNTTKALINRYNDLVHQINSLVLEEQQLTQELSGHSLPAKASSD